MAALTDYAENLALAWLFTLDTVTRPTDLFVALHTADPTETGAVSEVTITDDADYIRKAITFATPSSGQTVSTLASSWTLNSASSGFTVTHASIWDAATGGNCLTKAALLVPRVMVADGVLTFNIGDTVAILD